MVVPAAHSQFSCLGARVRPASLLQKWSKSMLTENIVQLCSFASELTLGHSFSYKEQASFNFTATVILEPKKIKSVTVSILSPSICHEVILVF